MRGLLKTFFMSLAALVLSSCGLMGNPFASSNAQPGASSQGSSFHMPSSPIGSSSSKETGSDEFEISVVEHSVNDNVPRIYIRGEYLIEERFLKDEGVELIFQDVRPNREFEVAVRENRIEESKDFSEFNITFDVPSLEPGEYRLLFSYHMGSETIPLTSQVEDEALGLGWPYSYVLKQKTSEIRLEVLFYFYAQIKSITLNQDVGSLSLLFGIDHLLFNYELPEYYLMFQREVDGEEVNRQQAAQVAISEDTLALNFDLSQMLPLEKGRYRGELELCHGGVRIGTQPLKLEFSDTLSYGDYGYDLEVKNPDSEGVLSLTVRDKYVIENKSASLVIKNDQVYLQIVGSYKGMTFQELQNYPKYIDFQSIASHPQSTSTEWPKFERTDDLTLFDMGEGSFALDLPVTGMNPDAYLIHFIWGDPSKFQTEDLNLEFDREIDTSIDLGRFNYHLVCDPDGDDGPENFWHSTGLIISENISIENKSSDFVRKNDALFLRIAGTYDGLDFTELTDRARYFDFQVNANHPDSTTRSWNTFERTDDLEIIDTGNGTFAVDVLVTGMDPDAYIVYFAWRNDRIFNLEFDHEIDVSTTDKGLTYRLVCNPDKEEDLFWNGTGLIITA